MVLELKQKPDVKDPSAKLQMTEYHEQLHENMEALSKANEKLVVTGFVIVQYASGTKLLIERTSYDMPNTKTSAFHNHDCRTSSV